jgi:uncharacterized protein (DUF488 family)
VGDEQVFTIGHSNTSIEEFLRLLRRDEIDVLVDVRSVPRSKFASQFDRDALEAACVDDSIGYVFAGDRLGGRPSGVDYYDDEGHVLYSRVARADWFQAALNELSARWRELRVAFMCSEEDPTDCHRRLLIGRVLRERGVAVSHLRRDGRVQSEEDLENIEPSAPLSLFPGEEDRSWRSIRSVLRKEAPKPSSKR